MKTIIGKIKFGVIPIPAQKIGDQSELIIALYGHGEERRCKLSEITEEQADEFVEWIDENEHYVDYIEHCVSDISAKESLISLLKANDVWIKEWEEKPSKMEFVDKYLCPSGECKAYFDSLKKYEQLPDDLLLIKLWI